ncbi:MAG: helix-turn-helix domain-containing protein, partial [Alphaproteobacteria bacterium]
MTNSSNPLRRTASVVDIVALSPKGKSLNDIAKSAKLPGSTVHRIVKSLVDIDYLSYDKDTKIYQLGPRIERLYQLSIGQGSIASLAEPLLKDLTEEFGEIAFVGRLSDRKVEIVALEMPRSMERTLVHPG